MGLLERFFRSFTEADIGFAIYFGDIQRMYIRYPHTKLIDLTFKVQLDCLHRLGKAGSLSGADELGPLLRTYGETDANLRQYPELTIPTLWPE